MTARADRLLLGADREARAWPVTAQVVDVTNADQFPNIKAAIDFVASLTPERRAFLQAKWNGEQV